MSSLLPFIKLVFKQWRWLLLGALLGLITLVAGIGLLSLSGWFIAAAAFAGLHAATATTFNFLIPGGAIRFFSLIRISGRYGERVLTHEATFKILTTLRVWVYRKIEPLMPAYLANYRSGDLLNRLVNDVDAMDNLYIRILMPTCLALIIALLLLVFLHFIAAGLAWLVFACLLITGIAASVLTAWLGAKPGQAIQVMITQMRIKIVEQLRGMMELMLFNAQQEQLATSLQASSALIRAQAKMAMIKGLIVALISLVMGITIWVTLYIGVPLVDGSLLNGALLGLIVLAIMAAFEAVLPIPLAFQYIGKTIIAAKRLLIIANAKPAVTFVAESAKPMQGTEIKFEQVSFAYTERESTLKNFNLSVAAGEKIAIVGPTGVGKSTIVNLLSREWDPCKGNITIGGVRLANLSEKDLRQTMTVISQRPYLFNASIRDNLLLAKPSATDAELMAALTIVQLQEFINNLPEGLNSWIGELGFNLSGGQQKRLAVARAILHDAPIWILDEITEGLDVVTRQQMLSELNHLMTDKTVIMISHRFADLNEQFRLVNMERLI